MTMEWHNVYARGKGRIAIDGYVRALKEVGRTSENVIALS